MLRQPKSYELLGLLPRLFTASHLQQLAGYGFSDLIPYARDFIKSESPRANVATLSDLLDEAFRLMRRCYPVEYVYKAYLLKRLLFGRHSPRTTACYFEFSVGEARADMLLVNGDAMLFEIKSRFDDPARLVSQLREYYKCFTRVTLVTEDGHAARYLDQLPDHVGVATLTPRLSISTKREAARHFDELEHESIFYLFRRAELYRAAEELLGIRVEDYPVLARYEHLLERFTSELSVSRFHEEAISTLRKRQRTSQLAERCEQLPHSLHVAAFSYRLLKCEWNALTEVLHLPPMQPPIGSPYVFSVSARQTGGGVRSSGS